jgi:hypothetical protein
VTNFVTLTPQGPDKFALILCQDAKRLRLMDRYEQRALLRRKFAIRAFDAARSGGRNVVLSTNESLAERSQII